MKTFSWWFWNIAITTYSLLWLHALVTNDGQATAYGAMAIACCAMAAHIEEQPCTPPAP